MRKSTAHGHSMPQPMCSHIPTKVVLRATAAPHRHTSLGRLATFKVMDESPAGCDWSRSPAARSRHGPWHGRLCGSIVRGAVRPSRRSRSKASVWSAAAGAHGRRCGCGSVTSPRAMFQARAEAVPTGDPQGPHRDSCGLLH